MHYLRSLLAVAGLALLLGLPAMAEDESHSQAELNQLLAPVALYPDTVLSHLLIASTYPLEVVAAERWARRHSNLEGNEALTAAENEPWDPSVRALVAFPELLERMSEDLDWTRELGDAFLNDESAVLATVQDLRQRAYESGHLKSTEHQDVVVEEKTIIVEPRVSEVIYLPYYDTRVVYGPWHWQGHPPKRWHHPSRGYWQAGIFWSFGTRIDRHHFYFSSFHWHNRHTVVVDLNHTHRPRFQSGRSVARYNKARHWKHNPKHRRGVDYRHTRVRKQYATPAHNARSAVHRTDRKQRAQRLERSLQQSRHNANNNVREAQATGERQRPRVERPGQRRDDSQVRRKSSNRLEQRSGGAERGPRVRKERAQASSPARESRTHSTRLKREQAPADRDDRAGVRQHRLPERHQPDGRGSFQRNTRERLGAARDRPSISDRARQKGRSDRR